MNKVKPIYDQIDEYLDYCQFVRQMSPMTMRTKRHTYKHLAGDTGIHSLEDLDNDAFSLWSKGQIARGVSARTINTRVTHIKALIKYHREMGAAIPLKLPLIAKLKEGPARRLFYTKEEINMVLDGANEMEWLLIRMAFDTGLRLSELTSLRLSNISGRRIIFIGKGFKPRESYMSNETRQRLDVWIEQNNISDYIWPSKRGGHHGACYTRIVMRGAFHRAADKHSDNPALSDKLRQFYPHSLRHSFGSDIQKSGYQLMEIQQMMGHSSAETTQRYLHGLDGHLEDLFMDLDRRRSGLASRA